MTSELVARLADTTGRLILFPVRHHSPACARALLALARARRPAAVLVEGPSEFNERIEELYLAHELPIAIYVHTTVDDKRRGAYYPFCVYSPEWQALQVARELGAATRFIDLPWRAVADVDDRPNRYADGPLRYGSYVDRLCEQLGVDDFDQAWDELFEIEDLEPAAYVRRAHELCVASRLLDPVRDSDRAREAFMGHEVRSALASTNGPVLVVTGGYHSAAILEAVQQAGETASGAATQASSDAHGAALTPYSYERLDRLTGYGAGMPAPGFYHHVWARRSETHAFDAEALLREIARALRHRKQILSTADLVGAMTISRALATLRGHREVWRRDLIDGLRSSVLKEELAHGGSHPLLDAIDEVLRGNRRGRLAANAPRPSLVLDLLDRLDAAEFAPAMATRVVDLDLEQGADRERSVLLHRVRLLGVSGFTRTDGTDFVNRVDLSRLWERWSIVWTPDFDATAIEATRYGGTLDEAVEAALAERIAAAGRHAGRAAALLVDAALASVATAGQVLVDLTEASLAGDNDLASVATALGHLLYLHRFDRALSAGKIGDLRTLVATAWDRARWLLTSMRLGAEAVGGIALLVQGFETGDDLPRDDLVTTLEQVASLSSQSPAVAGAAVGALWTLGATDASRARHDLERFRDPARLGDYLAGLFELAREAVQRREDLLGAIDEALAGFADDEFLEASPALVLAFSRFTPREKHHIARTLFGGEAAVEAAPLTVDPADASRALELEGRLFALLTHYGIRGGAS
jgi:hypothetical protein